MAQQIVFLEYKVDGFLTNANSVTLSSEDGTFGIKELETDTVVVANDTVVTNPSTGRYEYVLNIDKQKIYTVSWKTIAEPNDAAIFKVKQEGPFLPVDDFQAVTEVRGKFKQGTLGGLQINIADFEGNAVNPTSIVLSVIDESGDIVTSSSNIILEDVVPEKINDGFFIFDWSIASTQAAGKYTIVWTYVVDGVREKEVQSVVVSENATDSAFYSTARQILRESFEALMVGNCVMRIPIYHEQARPTRDLKTYRFTKGQWNQNPRIRLYRNDRTIETGVEIDYFKGQVKFTEPQLYQDVINADYTFKWFSDREIDQFIDNGINMLNSFPPFSPAFTPATLLIQGSQFIPAVLHGASMDALRNLMMCLQFQEPQRYFGGEDAARRAFDNMETLKQNHEKMWETLMGNKKLGPYPQTRLVVIPEFTLPGGRSRWFRFLFSSGSG